MPSSLTEVLPIALVFSTRPPVSVCGTVTRDSLEAFLGSLGSTTSGLLAPPSPLRLCIRISLDASSPYRLGPESTYRLVYPPASPLRSSISTWYGNLNPLSIAYGSRPRLRTDLPDEDYPSVGNLGLLANMFLTRFSLLMPAFSLLSAPPALTDSLLCTQNAPLLIHHPKMVDPAVSVSGLAPLYCRRRITRPVSYYALF